ncbi:MAG TPA: DJ-1/PfpI family protein, partial [Treponemataceae bacterium]|nr:DJ-1/PfpI family protein [Treponemataceae bacterium]
MNKKDVHIVILLADGFEEIETVVPYDLLVRAGFTVKTIAFSEDSLV